MNKDDFISKIQEIGQCEDVVQIRTKLAELNDEVSPIFDNVDTLTTENNKYKEDNESLRSANMQLFLRVGGRTEQQANEDVTGTKPTEKLKFEDLFNDKGGLK